MHRDETKKRLYRRLTDLHESAPMHSNRFLFSPSVPSSLSRMIDGDMGSFVLTPTKHKICLVACKRMIYIPIKSSLGLLFDSHPVIID